MRVVISPAPRTAAAAERSAAAGEAAAAASATAAPTAASAAVVQRAQDDPREGRAQPAAAAPASEQVREQHDQKEGDEQADERGAMGLLALRLAGLGDADLGLVGGQAELLD